MVFSYFCYYINLKHAILLNYLLSGWYAVGCLII